MQTVKISMVARILRRETEGRETGRTYGLLGYIMPLDTIMMGFLSHLSKSKKVSQKSALSAIILSSVLTDVLQ